MTLQKLASKTKIMSIVCLGLLAMPTFSMASSITVAVAANVSYAIDELKKEFSKQCPDINTKIIMGSSGKLTAQIKNRAPYGLFMSADMKYPNSLYKEGLTFGKPVIYAQGALAYLSNKKQDFSQGIKLLTNTKIKKIAIANPKTAPYGIAAAQALKSAKLYETLKPKFVYGESVSQTVTYAIRAADIGLVAKSALYNPHMLHFKEGINWNSVDTNLYEPINQGMVILKSAKSHKNIKVFYDFILSDRAKKIFRKYGYKTI